MGKYFTNIFILSKIELPPALAGGMMMSQILTIAFEEQIFYKYFHSIQN